MEEKELKLKKEILKLEIEKLTLEIELEKLKHKEYWQPIVTTTTGDYKPTSPSLPYNPWEQPLNPWDRRVVWC